MTIKEAMHKATFVEKTLTIKEVAEVMDKKNIGSVIVGTKEESLGLFSERDIVKKIVSKGIIAKTAKVKDYMSKPVHIINVNKRLVDAMNFMTEKKIRRLPVENNGTIVGMLSIRSVSQNMKYSYMRARVLPSFREKMPGFW